MPRKSLIILVLFSISSFLLYNPAQAWRSKKFKHTDRNKDGTIDKKEIKMEKKWEKTHRYKKADTNNDGVIDSKEKRLSWRYSKCKVNTSLESKYDTNSNGWIDPTEAKEMLKDKYTMVKTDGKAKVDTDIEREYDTDGNGIIDKSESIQLKEDID